MIGCQTQPQWEAAPSSAGAEDGVLKCKVLWECLCNSRQVPGIAEIFVVQIKVIF